MRVTIKDVAQRAGVSVSTVSNVLNGRFQRVSPATRERVYEAIRELNYVPNQVARSLVRRRTDVIGVLVANINRDPYPAAVKGLDETFSRHGFTMILSSHDNDPQKEETLLQVLVNRQVDGIVVVSQSGRPVSAAVHRLSKTGLPVVAVNPMPGGGERISSIQIDNESGAYAATRHLIRLGHREIGCVRGYVRGPYAIPSAIERFHGYTRAMEEAGLPVDPAFVLEGSYGRDGGWRSAYDLVTRLVRSGKMPSALVCANDYMAVGTLHALNAAGLQVPQDVAVIGHDNTVLSRFSLPPLTTVEQPMYEAGVAAAQILLAMIGGDTEVRTLKLPCKLIVRESCGGAEKLSHDFEGGVDM